MPKYADKYTAFKSSSIHISLVKSSLFKSSNRLFPVSFSACSVLCATSSEVAINSPHQGELGSKGHFVAAVELQTDSAVRPHFSVDSLAFSSKRICSRPLAKLWWLVVWEDAAADFTRLRGSVCSIRLPRLEVHLFNKWRDNHFQVEITTG